MKELHSYEVPESIALDVTAGSAAYLDWVRESTATSTAAGAGAAQKEGKVGEAAGVVDAGTGSTV